MSDALKLARINDDDSDTDELLSPLCRSIVDGPYERRSYAQRDDRADEIAALTERIAQLETKKSAKAITRRDFENLVETIGSVLGEALRAEIDPLHAKIVELEKRLAQPVWRGTWHAGMSVEPGSFVTDKGSMWIAVEQSNGERPGESSCFRLVVKNGAHSDNGSRRHVQTGIRQ